MTLNEQAIAKMLNDSSFYSELKAFLEGLIDAELAKPDAEMNCNLIEECTDILLAAEGGDNNNAAILIPFVSSERLIQMAEKGKGFASLSKGARAAIIAASAAALMLGSNAAVAATTGVNVLSSVGSAVVETLESWGIIKSDAPQETKSINNSEEEKTLNNPAPHEEATEEAIAPAEEAAPQPRQTGSSRGTEEGAALSEEKGAPVALRLSFADNFKTEYYWGESLDLNGLTVTAVYKDNETQSVPVKDCTVSGYNKALEGTQKILVEYEGAKASFDITLRKTEKREERFVTGVEGNPPTKQVYTTDDSSLQLYGLKVRLIYSDGTYSEYYTYNSAAIVKGADFTQTGEQKVTLRIAGKADYTYTIIVNEAVAENYDASIKRILFRFSSYGFKQDQELENTDFRFEIEYYDNNKRNEVIKYADHKDEIEIYNLDLTEITNQPKTMTVGYRGHYATILYTVTPKLTIKSADINTYNSSVYSIDAGPKFLYYKGEPLGYDEGEAAENIIAELKSSNQQINTTYNNLIMGCRFAVGVSYLEDTTISRVYSSEECVYVGYDPYTEGYQTVDIYTPEGEYLTSYTVFVYGDNGFAPLRRPLFEVIKGKESQAIPQYQHWAKCTGEGGLSTESEDIATVAHHFTEEPNELGKVNIFAELPDGTQYPYSLRYSRKIKKCEFPTDNSTLLYINLNEIDDYDLGERKCRITFEDGGIEEFSLNEMIRGYNYSLQVKNTLYAALTKSTDINSVFANMLFSLDRSLYSGTELIKGRLYCYVYRDGYKDSIQLVLEDKPLEQGAYYGVDYTENNFRRNTDFYLSAYDNAYWVSKAYKPEVVSIEGVEWGTVGDYTAIIKTELLGVEFSCEQDIHIVQKVYDAKCSVIFDPNADTVFGPGEEFDATGIQISYTDRLGNVTPISEENISYSITVDGSGHKLNNELYNEWFKVQYTCTLPNGKTESVTQAYKTGFCINNYSIQYEWEPLVNGVIVTFEPIEGATYYTVEFFGETYRIDVGRVYYVYIDGKRYESTKPFVVCDRGLEDGTYINSSKTTVKVTAYGINEKGELIKGRATGIGKSPFVISGYVAPED